MSSKADRYRDTVKRHMDGGSKGTGVMVAIFVLSAILSALFFWRHSTGVFAGIPWIFATVLGLLVGLIPSELAFFGWKDIQKKKEDMTGPQVFASNSGMWLGILFSVMNIVGLFLTSFPGAPLPTLPPCPGPGAVMVRGVLGLSAAMWVELLIVTGTTISPRWIAARTAATVAASMSALAGGVCRPCKRS